MLLAWWEDTPGLIQGWHRNTVTKCCKKIQSECKLCVQGEARGIRPSLTPINDVSGRGRINEYLAACPLSTISQDSSNLPRACHACLTFTRSQTFSAQRILG
jgi:hypothetical protein